MTNAQRRFGLSFASMAVASVAAWLWLREFEVSARDVEEIFTGFRWTWLPSIFILLLLHVALSAARWVELEKCLGAPQASFRLGFTSGAIAMGLGTVLPAPLMSVACRSLANRLVNTSGGRGAVSGLLDQLCDFAAYAWLAIPAILAILSANILSFLILAPLAIAVGWPVLTLLVRLEPSLRRSLPAFAANWLPILLSKSPLFRIYVISMLRVANTTLVAILIGISISEPISAVGLSVAVPLVSIANALVMLPGAIGISEWGFTAVLVYNGAAQETVVSFVLANRIILTALPIALALLVSCLLLVRLPRKRPIG